MSPTTDGSETERAGVSFLGRLQQKLARSFEAGNRLTELGPDAGNLRQRHDEEAEKQDVGEQPTDGQSTGFDLPCADQHDQRADQSEGDGRSQARHRADGQSPHGVVEQALRSVGEFGILARLGP